MNNFGVLTSEGKLDVGAKQTPDYEAIALYH